MGLACNIDRRGKRLRAISGSLSVLAAIAVGGFLWPLAWWGWLMTAGLLLGGAFQIFEAAAGWCAVRAMGFRTPV